VVGCFGNEEGETGVEVRVEGEREESENESRGRIARLKFRMLESKSIRIHFRILDP